MCLIRSHLVFAVPFAALTSLRLPLLAAIALALLAGCKKDPPAAGPVGPDTPVQEKPVPPEDRKPITPEELDKLPVGIKVVHEPAVALATLTGKSDYRAKYTWWFKTTVSAIDGDVTVVEFGGFGWDGKQWVGGETITGKPYGATEFADWYKCPNAVLKKGESYSDPRNWSTDPELRPGKARWYVIGVDAKGNRVKGEAVIEQKAEIDPKKPKDPE